MDTISVFNKILLVTVQARMNETGMLRYALVFGAFGAGQIHI
jgi:hypothetical protein